MSINEVKNIVYLSRCVLKGRKADPDRIASMDLDALYVVTEKHSMTAITGYALRSAGVSHTAFEVSLGRAIRKNLLMQKELKRITERLKAEHIWYMPLKGAVLSRYYPSVGLRQMADIDILIDSRRADSIRAIMTELGFDAYSFGLGAHDVYRKQPFYNFELHRHLFEDISSPVFSRYYQAVEKKLVDTGDVCERSFSVDDFYIYMTAHSYKHFDECGTGLRSLMDVFVYFEKFSENMDMSYVRREMDKLGIVAYEDAFRNLALHLFGGKRLSQEEKDMLRYIVDSGTYGKIENSVLNRLKKNGGSRVKYLFGRFFVDREFIKAYYPFFYRHPGLTPVLWIIRTFKALTVKRRKMCREIRAVLGKKKDNV